MKVLKKSRMISMIGFVMTIIIIWSCENNDDGWQRESYNPSKPVRIDGFEPDSGGMATKVFINGSNFGSDLSQIKVYFNDLRAPVVGSDGSHLYVITPRQPGSEVTISVVVNGDSAVYTDKKFLYRTMTTVTTIVGRKGSTEFQGGRLAETTLQHPFYLCLDAENNLFVSHWINSNFGSSGTDDRILLINEEQDIVQELYKGRGLGIPTPDAEGKVIMVPVDNGDGYYYFDPDVQWAPRPRQILHPTPDLVAQGIPDFSISTKASFETSVFDDGNVYLSTAQGYLIKFDPVTRLGQLVKALGGGAARLCFDPSQPHLLYMAYWSNSTIYRYNLITEEYELYAGRIGVTGYRDGYRLEAEFNYPYQMVVDEDGSLVVADRNNHCLRRITPDGMVSTLIGKGGIEGYQDGNPEDALFSTPAGLAIDRKSGSIYVADYGNNVIRKLALE